MNVLSYLSLMANLSAILISTILSLQTFVQPHKPYMFKLKTSLNFKNLSYEADHNLKTSTEKAESNFNAAVKA